MEIRDDCVYTSDHEWARVESADTVRVGITDFAQDALGDIVYVGLPVTGTQLQTGAILGEIESTKSVSEIYAPISGEILAINEALTNAPGTLNTDPYDSGWLCVIAPRDASEIDGLLSAEEYGKLTVV